MAPAPLRTAPAYRAITSLQALTPLNTVGLFAAPGASVDPSPIDQFIANTEVINIIYMPAPDPLPAEFGTLVLLGYMSAVESFFRALLRGLINIDEHTRRLAEPMNVSFGAALHHRPSLLPEALFEEMSFAGLRNIEIMLREIIGIKGQFPGEILTVLSEFKKVCELRHCCIHRFGKLGAKNAITLGLERHSQILEHPFSPTKDNLQEIADLLRTFAKTINNFIFHSVLNRTTDTSTDTLVIQSKNGLGTITKTESTSFGTIHCLLQLSTARRHHPQELCMIAFEKRCRSRTQSGDASAN
jgi:hypothetical protein